MIAGLCSAACGRSSGARSDVSFAKLDELGHRLESLEHALSMLRVDEAVQMPAGGGEKRAEAMSRRSPACTTRRRRARDRRLDRAPPKGEALNEEQQAALRELERALHQHDLPPVRVRPPPDRGARCGASSSGASFAPRATGRASCRRSKASSRWCARKRSFAPTVLKLDPYDALMEQYDPGNRAADIAPVFAEAQDLPQGLRPRGAGAPGREARASAR